ncbi:MAG: hypothetical protein FJ139_10475 [Deltaproteobacteria bacterium]|nr:hypothetical protein [Deltaproteobacteria bacterium]
MKCLNCDQEMMNYEIRKLIHKLSYDICEACGGLWLDRGELDKMAFQVQGSIEYCSEDEAKNASGKAQNCPRCQGLPLHKVYFIADSTGTILDHCKNCGGFWLDGGELSKINKRLTEIMPVSGKGFSEFITDVHLPFWSKRIKRDSKETDFSVPVVPIKHAKLQENTKYSCPACKNNLDLFKVYGLQIESCSACHGIWFDKEELRKLKDKVDEDSWGNLNWMDDEIEAIEKTSAMLSERLCPKCQDSKLVSTHFGNSQTIIDWCQKCHGVWLDRNEFENITQYSRDELNKITSEEMKKKVIQEVKEIWNGPESKISEILDAKAAISALINISIFEHPDLAQLLIRTGRVGRSIGV